MTDFIETGFTSKPLDKETGLYNFPQRYYDSRNVKWLTLDPIGIELMNPMEMNQDGKMIPKRKLGKTTSLHWYNYCGNNPIMYHDPEGLNDKKTLTPQKFKELFIQKIRKDNDVPLAIFDILNENKEKKISVNQNDLKKIITDLGLGKNKKVNDFVNNFISLDYTPTKQIKDDCS